MLSMLVDRCRMRSLGAVESDESASYMRLRHLSRMVSCVTFTLTPSSFADRAGVDGVFGLSADFVAVAFWALAVSMTAIR